MKPLRLVVLALTLCTSFVHADTGTPSPVPKKYAILSLIGDAFTVAIYRGATGSNLDPNDHKKIILTNAGLDHVAIAAVDDAIHQYDPAANTLMLTASASDTYTNQANMFDGKRFISPAWLSEIVEKEHATHLVLVTKHRADTNIKMADSRTGSGKLEGLGFYLDGDLETRRLDTGEHSVGYIAPYAYFKISLIEFSSATLLKEQRITASRMFTTSRRKEALTPWEALTASEKLNKLQMLIKQETRLALPALLTPPTP
jgi:hypothetical protein